MKEIYEQAGVIKTGHFKLSSGRHSDTYVNKDAIYASAYFEMTIEKLWCLAIDHFEDMFDVVTGPAVAGAVLAAPVAYALCSQYQMNCRFVYPEKVEWDGYTIMMFKRGYDKIIKGQRVLIIEDIITTGSSIMKTAQAIAQCGGTVAGVVAIWNRTGWGGLDVPVVSLINHSVASWKPDKCPLCYLNKPLTDPKTD